MDAYEALWSPVILPPALSLVPQVVHPGCRVVVDIGAGTGALHGTISSAAPGARIVALDASAGMLSLVRERGGAAAVLADALALPLADQAADAVLLAYVLFHLADPALAIAEAARVLGRGGRVATITWAWERASRADQLVDEALTAAGVPAAPPRRVDAGLNRPEDVAELLSSAGLEPERVWPVRLRRQWDRDSFAALATGSGTTRLRLSRASEAVRADALSRLHEGLSRLSPAGFAWEGEVLCAVAVAVAAGVAPAAAPAVTPPG